MRRFYSRKNISPLENHRLAINATIIASTKSNMDKFQSQRRFFYQSSPITLGLSKTTVDMPMASDTPPAGRHFMVGKREKLPHWEERKWKWVKKWEMTLAEEWDDLEKFKGLPKPKKLFGNEAAEIVWPYAVLMEHVIKIHPFTKSIYCYYGQHSLTPQGVKATELAKRFAREVLMPISFHNSQVYVETEMLLEFNDTPWIVINCLDGRREIVPIFPQGKKAMDGEKDPVDTISSSELESTEEEHNRRIEDMQESHHLEKVNLVRTVLKVAERLGSTVENPKEMWGLFNERPNQNHYIRVDYQWFGNSPEERLKHTVQWDYDPAVITPNTVKRDKHIAEWMSNDSDKQMEPRSLQRLLDKTASMHRKRYPKGATQAAIHRMHLQESPAAATKRFR